MEKLAMGYYQICIWIMRMAYINLLWIAFSLLGLGVFGFFPSTVAMFVVIRKWVTGEKDIPIFQTFWDAFKKDFIKTNVLGYILFFVGFILYIDLKFVQGQSSVFFTILKFGLLILFFIYFIILLYIFPIFVHFQLTFKQYIKWSIVIGIVHPILTLLMVAGVLVAYYVTFSMVPGLMIFFGGSTIAFVIMWGAFQTFSKFEFQENYN